MCVTEPLPLNEMAIRHNAAMLEYCRTSVSALAGSTAGILGLTGLYGFAFYFLTAFMMSVRSICLFVCKYLLISYMYGIRRFFDAVGWATGRASGL